MRILKYLWQKSFWSLLSLLFIAVIMGCLLLLYMQTQLPDVAALKQVNFQYPLRIYASDGKLIAEYGEKRRIPVNISDVPPTLIQAILATEDQRFFDHHGVDVFGLGRAFIKMVKTGTKAEGGSTITMQVARNFFLSNQKTFLRKFNEILLALKIELILSKNSILELYVNKIYFGNRAYGVAAAAQVYYGKTVQELSLAQMAMIAGLPKAPSAINPLADPSAALKRRNHVLVRMLEAGYIDKATYHQTIRTPVTASYHQQKIELKAPYVAELVRRELFSQMGESAYTQGYQVYTTVDSQLQEAANHTLEQQLLAYDRRHGYRGVLKKLSKPGTTDITDLQTWREALKTVPTFNGLQPAVVLDIPDDQKYGRAMLRDGKVIRLPWKHIAWARRALASGYLGHKPKKISDVLQSGDVIVVRNSIGGEWALAQFPEIEGALVTLHAQTGAINSLIGGFNFNQSHFNRVTQAKRQPGSGFKPLLYAAALEKGLTLATIINDAPVVRADSSLAQDWRPRNVTRRFYGPTRLRTGLVSSRNLVSIRILDRIGIPYTVDFLERFGFAREDIPASLSLALGTLMITPLQLATSYAAMTNGGYKVEPYLIDKVTDINAKLLYQAEPLAARKSIVSPQVAYLMHATMLDVVQNGTGRGVKSLQRADMGGKTGTTNQYMDAWFSGFASDYVTTVWVGFDQPRSLKEYGAQAALPIWRDYMAVALKGKSEYILAEPPGLVRVRIDPETGQLAYPGQKDSIFEIFREENVPKASTLGVALNPYL